MGTGSNVNDGYRDFVCGDCATSLANSSIHDNLDLDLRRGEILGVVGGSGTGKSVLLRSIIGLQEPAAGDISVFGQESTRNIADDVASCGTCGGAGVCCFRAARCFPR